MSQETPGNEIDLIDFHHNSPVLPRTSPPFESTIETSDNLIDSELPVLEKKLLETNKLSSARSDSRNSVDIEDILITLDDEIDGIQQVHVYDNNSEFLDVLKNLDDVLNACLVESDAILDEEYSRGDRNAIENKDIRSKLRHYEENYNQFLASGYVNRGYANTEPSERIRRRLSADDLRNLAEDIDYPKHATVGVVKKKRCPLYKNNGECIGFTYDIRQPSRTTVCSDEDIDWSWLEDVARDINSEKCLTSTTGECSISLEHENPLPDSTVIAMRLRDSMRRLDPLLIPNIGSEVGLISAEPANPLVHEPQVPPVLSAVSNNPSGSTNTRTSRSRSCDSSGGARRPRSSCSSTRSGRQRSLSSSLSSVSSSAESSPSFNPSASTSENVVQTNTATSTPRR